MTVRELLKDAQKRLEAAGVPEAAFDASQLLASVLNTDPLALRLEPARQIGEEQTADFEALVLRRAAREPLQYILCETEFAGFRFRVRPGVLIPRFDTEIVFEEARKRLHPGQHLLDIGTGSGTLAVSLAAAIPGLCVTAVDISPEALEIAKENAALNGVDIDFRLSDCMDVLSGERFDMIVSNPPYIDREEMATLMPEVCREPRLALYGGPDGLDFYRRICREAPQHLTPGGFLIFEIGWKQKDAVSELLRESIGEPFACRDLGGNWRCVGARSAAAVPDHEK